MPGEGMRLHVDEVAAACSFFDAAATEFDGLPAAGLDNGIAGAFPGGSSAAQSCAGAADSAQSVASALARRSRALAGAARSAVATIQATDEQFAAALDQAVTL